MDFGKVENLDEVDFTLPDDHTDTEKLLDSLKKQKKQKQNVYIGCAKWGIKEWVGKIYPPKTKEKDFRKLYLPQFNCIELNPTHYRIQSASTIKEWRTDADKDFKFCPKFYQGISHFSRLKNCERLTKEFYKSIENFENNLGVCFLQLPPNFSPKSFPDLENYLKTLPKEVEVCVELRHPEWFRNSEIADKTFDMFRKNKIGTVITDTAGRRDLVHQRLTTPTAFIRFVGNNLHPTDYKRIDDWVLRIKHWLESGLKTLYFIMHMHEEKDSPELCAYVIKQVNKHCGLNIKEPVFYSQVEQGNIF